jgi:dTDP-4-dehydrorhamnose 3,5-epimerase-like enzyme
MDKVTQHILHSVADKQRGTLCVAECPSNIPFKIERIFYIYDMPLHTVRAQHAHRTQGQFLICLNGKVELQTIRKDQETSFTLERPDIGIYLPHMTWVTLKVIAADTVCMIATSGLYDEEDYIRNFPAFQSMMRDQQ